MQSLPTIGQRVSEAERISLPGTFQWLASHTVYERWLQHNHYGILHIFGKHGCGKTTISIFLAERLKQLGYTVCYFSFNDGDERQKSAGAVYVSYLTQLLYKKPELFNLVLPAYREKDPSTGWSFHQVRSLYKSCALSTLDTKCIFVIDGIDECDSSRADLLHDCVEMLSTSQSIRFLALSRPEYDILQRLTTALKLNLDEERGLTKDIESFINAGIDKILIGRKGLRKLFPEIRSSLIDRADGMFLLVRLLLEELQTVVPASPQNIRLALKSLPKSLSNAYEKMLMRIPTNNREWARKTLCWVLFALRPLSTSELETALAVDGVTDSMESVENNTSCDIENDLNLTFGSLIKIEQNTVHITHRSAREFFLGEKHDPAAWYALGANWGNQCIGDACIAYIKLCDLEPGSEISLPQVRKKERKKQPRINLERFPLLEYSVRSWPEHIRRLNIEVPLLSTVLSTFLQNDLHRRKWEHLYWILQHSRRTKLLDSPLHICAMVGNMHLLRHLLEHDGTNVTAKTENGETALHVAASYGTKDVLEFFLDGRILVTALTKERETALHSSIRMGQSILAQTILEKQRESTVDTILDRKGWRALHLAALKGFSPLVNCLIARITEVDFQDVQKRTPLHLAAFNGHLDVVKSLINASANVHLRDSNGCTALYKAVQRQQREIVVVLIENGADPSAGNRKQWTPLHEAASHCDVTTFNILLKSCQGTVDLQDENKRTPLQIACMEGSDDIVDFLLRRNADPFHQDTNGMDALDLAADNHHESIVDSLLKQNKLIFGKGKLGKLYQRAAAHGMMRMVEFWLSRIRDINIRDNDERTALHFAAMNGRYEIVELLISRKADSSLQDRHGRTPLSSALQRRQCRTALLLANESNLDLVDEKGNTPLHWAARRDFKGVGSALLEHNANIDAQDRRGRTPLQIAILYDNTAFADFLIGNNASSEVSDMFGWTALDWAVWEGSEALSKCFEESRYQTYSSMGRETLAQKRIKIGINQLKSTNWEWQDEDLRLIGQSAFILGADELAETVFREYCTRFQAWICDKCWKSRKMNPGTGVTERNICKVCFDVDICEICFRRRMTKDFASPRHCRLEHSFLKVDFRSGIPASDSNSLARQLSSWMEVADRGSEAIGSAN